MTGKFSIAISLCLLMPTGLSYAQSYGVITKVYSGYLHKNNKHHKPFLKALFSRRSSPEGNVDSGLLCSLEFRCPASPSHQSPTIIPGELTYFIGFKNDSQSPRKNPFIEKDILKKFVIKIYTKDDQEHTLDFNAEIKEAAQEASVAPYGPDILNPGQRVKVERHVYDPYLIYLILGQDIHRVEIVSAVPEAQEAYVLDNLEINEGH